MARSVFSVGDEVIVNFPQRLDQYDQAVGVAEPGMSIDARIIEHEEDCDPEGPWWRVCFKDPSLLRHGHPVWICREKWFEPKGGPW